MEFETFTSTAPVTHDNSPYDNSPHDNSPHDNALPGRPVPGGAVLDGRTGFCAGCAAETVFEQPVCPDGHGDLCPEWVCTDCGLAVVVPVGDYDGPVEGAVEPAGRQPARTRAA